MSIDNRNRRPASMSNIETKPAPNRSKEQVEHNFGIAYIPLLVPQQEVDNVRLLVRQEDDKHLAVQSVLWVNGGGNDGKGDHTKDDDEDDEFAVDLSAPVTGYVESSFNSNGDVSGSSNGSSSNNSDNSGDGCGELSRVSAAGTAALLALVAASEEGASLTRGIDGRIIDISGEYCSHVSSTKKEGVDLGTDSGIFEVDYDGNKGLSIYLSFSLYL